MENLTNKEKQIYLFLAKRPNYELVKNAMKITRNTLKAHLKSIFKKLEISSLAELVKYYYVNENNILREEILTLKAKQ